MIAFRSCLISSIHVRCGLPLGRLTFLRYSASASLAGVSGCSLMRWPSQLRRRLCIVVLHSSVLVLVYSSMVVIFLGQCMPRIFLRCLLWKVLTVFSGRGYRHDRSGLQRQLAIGTTGRVSNTVGYRHDMSGLQRH